MVSGTSSPWAIRSLISAWRSSSDDIVSALVSPLLSNINGVLAPLPCRARLIRSCWTRGKRNTALHYRADVSLWLHTDPGAPFSQTISLGHCILCAKAKEFKSRATSAEEHCQVKMHGSMHHALSNTC